MKNAVSYKQELTVFQTLCQTVETKQVRSRITENITAFQINTNL